MRGAESDAAITGPQKSAAFYFLRRLDEDNDADTARRTDEDTRLAMAAASW